MSVYVNGQNTDTQQNKARLVTEIHWGKRVIATVYKGFRLVYSSFSKLWRDNNVWKDKAIWRT